MAENPSEHLTPELRAFEAALASLAPRPSALDRDRLMYEAGRASVGAMPVAPTSRWAWPVAFSGMSAVAASLFLALWLRPPAVVERVVQRAVSEEIGQPNPSDVDNQAIVPASIVQTSDESRERRPESPLHRPPASSEPSYFDLRDRVLAMGIDAWQPPSHVAPAENQSQPTYRDLLIELGEIN